MGLLDKLWDDTVAGPQPDTGLGRLRKFSTFSIRTDFSKDLAAEGAGNSVAEEVPRVTRSIMIKRPAGSPSSSSNGTPPASPAASPAGSTPPVSPFYGFGKRDWNRFRRKSTSDAYERAGSGSSVTASAPTTPSASSSASAEPMLGSGSGRNPFRSSDV